VKRHSDGLGPWRSARTLADLGKLTARWLEGAILSQPGYAGGYGPDEETGPLVGVLAAANRAGYVTNASQPGGSGLDGAGVWWSQRAAVSGFADGAALARLRVEAMRASLIIICGRPRRWRTIQAGAVGVTRYGGRCVTRFGSCLSVAHLRDGWAGYGECHPDAVAALCQAWQVTLVDPQWGRDSVLWPVLRAFAGGGPR
jgi:hypothetical protein